MSDELLMRDLARYNKKKYFAFLEGEVIDSIPSFERLLDNRQKKVARIKDSISILAARYKSYVYFCTFTFNDYYLSCSDRTRKRLIKSTLYGFDNNIMFLLNVDYGKKNGRLHYHAIIGTDNSDNFRTYLKSNYPCMSSCDRVYFNSKRDLVQVSKYINKLSNHAVKDTTRRSRMVRNFTSYEKLDSQTDRIFYKLEDINILYGVRS